MPRYIDADKLKEKAENAHFYDEAGFDAPERAVRESDIDSIPTADVRENVHGRWICEQVDLYRKFKVTCNKCGWYSYENYDSYCDPSEFDFCPQCGARMDEEAEG